MDTKNKNGREELITLNERTDKVIKKLSTSKIKNSMRDELLDEAREIKAQIANMLRLIDGC